MNEDTKKMLKCVLGGFLAFYVLPTVVLTFLPQKDALTGLMVIFLGVNPLYMMVSSVWLSRWFAPPVAAVMFTLSMPQVFQMPVVWLYPVLYLFTGYTALLAVWLMRRNRKNLPEKEDRKHERHK